MKRASLVVVAAVLCAAFPAAQSKTLDIYVLDVEGGNATLFVTPSRESVLVDTGNGGPAAVRDADRIMAAVKDAGLTQIDALVTSHWHGDHMGAMAELASRIPIRHYLDHGGNVQPAAAIDAFLKDTYPGLLAKSKHTVVKAGRRAAAERCRVALRHVGAREHQESAAGCGRPNPHCAGFKPHEVNPVSGQPVGNTEDEHSVGSHVTFGKFRALYLADFPWNKEFEIDVPHQSPGNGRISPGVAPRPAQLEFPGAGARAAAARGVINNGIRKGGQPETMRVLYSSPGLEDFWQVHVAQLSGPEHDIPGIFVANIVDDPQHSPAYWIKVSAQPDGSFTVTNSRNGFRKTYALP